MVKAKAGQAWRTLLVGVFGALIGGFATATVISGLSFRLDAAAAEAEEIAYVGVQRMTLPVVDSDGGLASYMTIDFALEVPAEKRVYVRQRVPEVRHAVNAAAWKSRLIAVRGGGLDIEETRAMLLAASRTALGPGNVIQIRVLTAVPV